jgi:hypothetical protein
MATTNYNTFDIPKGGYAAFDALSLRQLIINRLNEQGTFTDQNYIGSNLASVIDIIAYAYHTLIFYLNRTSTESMFTEAQLYENINRIVKLIDYSPVGAQTSTLSFKCSADTFPLGLYTIPRYSFILASGNIPYSFNEDVTFNKTVNNNIEYLQEVSEQKLLYQGVFQEYPTYTATGEEYETVFLNPGNNIVDHFNIDVYVKPILTGKWEQFSKTPNLYLEDATSKKYEIRLNQNARYEIKFGNDINGYKLQSGDEVGIYYLQSLGPDGVVTAGATSRGPDYTTPKRFNTIRYNQILNDVLQNQYKLVQENEVKYIKFTNSTGSTDFAPAETAQQIKENAPITYRSQYRLVTAKDYETFIRSNFANIISDLKIFNNTDYIFNYLRYFHSIGLTEPEKTNRALFNQINYADNCNFNNVYLVIVPRSSSTNLNYLLPIQKELINSALQDNKVLTSETTFVDPIYMAVGFGVTNDIANFNPATEESFCTLNLLKQPSSRRSDMALKQDVINIITNYFSQNNLKLGQVLETQQIAQDILNIDGVVDFYTSRSDKPEVKTKGLSLFVWNPLYVTNDKTVTTNNVPLLSFQYLYWNNYRTLANRINISTSNLLG